MARSHGLVAVARLRLMRGAALMDLRTPSTGPKHGLGLQKQS